MKPDTQSEMNSAQSQTPADLREALSALMDSEANELELRRILRELPDDAELSATWKRYHTVRASLRQEIHSNPAVNLLDGIKARLADEAVRHPLHGPGRLFRSGILRYVGQGAIAASVALAALVSVSLLDSNGAAVPAAVVAGADLPATGTSTDNPVLNGDYDANASELARTVSTDAEALNRLEQAVYREFGEVPPADEIPVNYTPDFPLRPVPAQ
jgi:sigma-E factor negative regulatory protein RseA